MTLWLAWTTDLTASGGNAIPGHASLSFTNAVDIVFSPDLTGNLSHWIASPLG
jgi:hypothetical protein